MSTHTVMGGSQGPPGQGLQAVDVGKQQQSLSAKPAPVLLPQGTSCCDALAWTKLPPRVLLPFPHLLGHQHRRRMCPSPTRPRRPHAPSLLSSWGTSQHQQQSLATRKRMLSSPASRGKPPWYQTEARLRQVTSCEHFWGGLQ